MPTSEFQIALTERIEFAVFVAYEGWVRASGYASANPYDVLARVLPGLPESLGGAVATHGGWGAFEPIAGMPADEARHLIRELAAQAASAQIAAVAPHAPDANLLVQVIADAVGRAVTVFIEDPESWRLALGPGERGQVAALGEAQFGARPGDPVPEESAQSAPASSTQGDEGGDYGAPGARVLQTLERALNGAESSARPDLSQFLNLSELWFVKSSSSATVASSKETAVATIGGLLIDPGSGLALQNLLARELEDARASLDPNSALADEPNASIGRNEAGAKSAGSGASEAASGSPAHSGASKHSDMTAGLPPAMAEIIDRWIELLNKASFYRVNGDGTIYRLSEAEAAEVVDTLVSVLVRRAQLDLSLPTLPGEPASGTKPPASTPPPAAVTQTVAQSDMADDPAHSPGSGLGSDTLHLPPPAATEHAHEPVLPAAADPTPDHIAMYEVAEVLPPVLPPIDHSPTDLWPT